MGQAQMELVPNCCSGGNDKENEISKRSARFSELPGIQDVNRKNAGSDRSKPYIGDIQLSKVEENRSDGSRVFYNNCKYHQQREF